MNTPPPTYTYTSYLRPSPGESWCALCFSEDDDKKDAEWMCRTCAQAIFDERAAKGEFLAPQASLVTLPGDLTPYGVRVRKL